MGCFGELGFIGIFSFLEESDDELLDFFFSTGGSFSESLEELEEDFGLAGFFSSLSELELDDLTFSSGFRGSVGGTIGVSLVPDFLLELLDDLLLLGESGFGSISCLGDSGFGLSLLSELDDDLLFGFSGNSGSVLGITGSSFGIDFLDDELDEDFLLLGDEIEGFSSGGVGLCFSSLSELDSESLGKGIIGSVGLTGGSTFFPLLEELLDELLLFFDFSFFLLELEELDESFDLAFSGGGIIG